MDYNKKYFKYKTKYIKLTGGGTGQFFDNPIDSEYIRSKLIPNTRSKIYICPNECVDVVDDGDVADIFNKLKYVFKDYIKNSIEYLGNRISIIVPSNAGQPGGGHGALIYDAVLEFAEKSNNLKEYNEDVKKFIKKYKSEIFPYLKIRNINDKTKNTLEEQIMRKWLTSTMENNYTTNNIYNKNIGLSWGLYKKESSGKLSTKTIQDIDYTVQDENPDKYKLAYVVNDVKIDRIPVNLLFTFSPNHNTVLRNPNMKAIFDPNNNKENYTNTAIENCIYACLLKASEGYILLPYLGSGEYSETYGQILSIEQKNEAKNNYISIVTKVCLKPDIIKKWFRIYIMFFA